jgi:hypothetical protein
LRTGPWRPGILRGAPAVGALLMTAALARHPISRRVDQLGEFESGMTASLFGAMPAAALGGLATIAVALLLMKLFPTLRNVERLE